MEYDESVMKIYIEANTTTAEEAGIYSITVTLDDTHDINTYVMKLYLICPEVEDSP